MTVTAAPQTIVSPPCSDTENGCVWDFVEPDEDFFIRVRGGGGGGRVWDFCQGTIFVQKIGRPASRDLRSIVQTRVNWNRAKFKVLYTDPIPSLRIILDQEEIYRPNMNTIEHHFHRESAVHILLEEDAFSASCSTGTGANHQKAQASRSLER